MTEIIIDYGEPQLTWAICGNHPLFGRFQCDDCKDKGNNIYCGKWFVLYFSRPHPPVATYINESKKM